MYIDIINDSNLTFVHDGEWLPSGEIKTTGDQPLTIAPNAPTRIEVVTPPSVESITGLSGVLWFVDTAKHNTYVSMAFSRTNMTGKITFICWAGVPPANLKAELGSAPRLEKDQTYSAPDKSCTWQMTPEGVQLHVPADLPCWIPPTKEDYALTGEGVANSPPGEEQGEEARPAEQLSKVLDRSRPRDAGDGLLQGAKAIGTGLAVGVGAVIGMPVQGAKQEGAAGFVKGLGIGIAGGAVAAITGVAYGTAQVGRGLMQIPAASRGRREEKVWDQELGQWVDIDLCQLERDVEAEKDEDDLSGGQAGRSSVEVKETEFYDLLKVDPGSTPAEIKKAYYKEARQCHPDKNPGDAEATAKFQKLSEVYQILSDPELRKKYDKEGSSGIQDQKVDFDPTAFFSLLFGSERFVAWTGELLLAMHLDGMKKTILQVEENSPKNEDIEEKLGNSMQRRQNRREVQCAAHLREKMDRCVYGRDPQGFEEQMDLEAHDLANADFGPELLLALGEIYQLRAEIYLANELVGRFSFAKRIASMKHNVTMAKHGLDFYGNMAGSVVSFWRKKKAHESASSAKKKSEESSGAAGSTSPEVREEAADEAMGATMEAAMEALPEFMQLAYSHVIRDIDSTMKGVGRKFLQDKSVPWQIRVRRAQALQRLGQIFSQAAARAHQEGERSKDSKTKAVEEVQAKLQAAFAGSTR